MGSPPKDAHASGLPDVGGRLESRYRYSIGLVYNTFPLPPKPPSEPKFASLVDAIIDARAAHPNTTLADLYDPDQMPETLRKAHAALDRAVDKLYRAKPFSSERERVEHLFGLYEKMTTPIEAEAKKKTQRKK